MARIRNRQEQILDLIGSVYDAALDEALWPGLASQIARTFDSTSTALQTQNVRWGAVQQLTLTANLDSTVWDAYRSYYYQHDVWAQRGAELGMSRVVASKDMVADSDLQRTEYYQDWLRKQDLFYVVGSVFPVTRDDIGILGIHRPQESGTYEEEDKRRVARFLPHLRRAIQIHRRLSDADIKYRAALDTLERTRTATLVVSGKGHIIYANQQAELLLREADAVSAVAGRLTTTTRSATERLISLIRTSIDTAAGHQGTPGGAVSILRSDRLPLSVLVAPFRPARDGFGASLPAAIVFIRDPERSTPATLVLRGLFDLTPAEASIASALAEGKAIDEIASSNGISLNTARTHLKSILSKTGTNRQAQLVALLLRSVAVLGRD